jgi:hypothetical protein
MLGYRASSGQYSGLAAAVLLVLPALCEYLGDDVEDQQVHDHADPEEGHEQCQSLAESSVGEQRHIARERT